MSTNHLPRLIGEFEGSEAGPLVVAIAALHGNEPAGVKALEQVFEQLEKERRENPAFAFRGKLLGLIGNLQAFQSSQRFLERDLNRVWTENFVQQLLQAPKVTLQAESREARELYEAITAECHASFEKVVFLDLHTTSAEGGVFSIPTNEAESLALAQHLGAPAIVGLQQSVSGTLLGFAEQGGFVKMPICVAFEAGQHTSSLSVSRAVLAILRCLRVMKNIGEQDLLEFLEQLTLPVLADIPPVVRLRYAHHIRMEDGFKMRPGYANFQPVQEGEHLADDVRGQVLSPDKGLILMPLYQAKGSDGFFIVQ